MAETRLKQAQDLSLRHFAIEIAAQIESVGLLLHLVNDSRDLLVQRTVPYLKRTRRVVNQLARLVVRDLAARECAVMGTLPNVDVCGGSSYTIESKRAGIALRVVEMYDPLRNRWLGRLDWLTDGIDAD